MVGVTDVSTGRGLRDSRGWDTHAPRGCARWGGAELGERVYAEKGKMMRREILGKCGGSKGKQKSRNAVGLAGRELNFAECGLSVVRFIP